MLQAGAGKAKRTASLPLCMSSICIAFHSASCVAPASNCASEYTFSRLSLACSASESCAHFAAPASVPYVTGLYKQ
jgi:hypothetical protein